MVCLTSAEDFQNFKRLVIAKVLDEVAHIARHNANVTSHVIECACVAFGGEDGDSSATLDEERPVASLSTCDLHKPESVFHLPLIGIRVPVHLAHRTGLDV